MVGAASALQGWLHLANREASLTETLIGLIFMLGGLSVLAGLLTPVGGTTIVLAAMLAWAQTPRNDTWDAPIPLVFLAGIALAVILVGPGWFSFDRTIFGRREIMIPGPAGSKSKSL